MDIKVKRIYDVADLTDGKRILVDRLWPRGISKDKAKIDLWAKDIAPSHDLRKWFGHEPEKWEEFKKRYIDELSNLCESLKPIVDMAREQTLTLLFSAKETRYNNAVVLKQYLESKKKE